MRFLKHINRFVHQKRIMGENLVFVYGTLKQGEPNHHWLQSKDNGYAKFVSKGRTVQKYPLVIASKYNIPFLLYSPGQGENVRGEIYEVDDKMLSRLDVLEDHPSFYIRDVDQVELISETDGEESKETRKLVDCWVYFLKKFKPELLENEYLLEYHSEGDHAKPYTPKQKRIPGYHAKADVLLS